MTSFQDFLFKMTEKLLKDDLFIAENLLKKEEIFKKNFELTYFNKLYKKYSLENFSTDLIREIQDNYTKINNENLKQISAFLLIFTKEKVFFEDFIQINHYFFIFLIDILSENIEIVKEKKIILVEILKGFLMENELNCFKIINERNYFKNFLEINQRGLFFCEVINYLFDKNPQIVHKNYEIIVKSDLIEKISQEKIENLSQIVEILTFCKNFNEIEINEEKLIKVIYNKKLKF